MELPEAASGTSRREVERLVADEALELLPDKVTKERFGAKGAQAPEPSQPEPHGELPPS